MFHFEVYPDCKTAEISEKEYLHISKSQYFFERNGIKKFSA
jgi:hypothetical protein